MDANYEDGYDPKYGHNRNAFEHSPAHLKVLGRIVKTISTPIALASEAIATKRDKAQGSSTATDEKQSGLSDEKETTTSPPDYDEVDPYPQQADEADWALDDAAADIDGEDEASGVPSLPTATASGKSPQRQPIPFPVVLPQRRPRTKTRGFVRAYPPSLSLCGIEQDVFLSFLKSLHKAAQTNPMLDVIQIGAGIAGFYPDLAVGLAMQSVQFAVGVAKEVQGRWQTNKFLDQANQDLFMPHGLFCMIVTYQLGGADDQPAGTVATKTVDLSARAVAEYAPDPEGNPLRTRLRESSGRTAGEAEMPLQCAQLVYPSLDRVDEESAASPTQGSSDGIGAKLKKSNKFVADYFDRRARMVEATAHPNSTLTALGGDKPQFASRMGDPNDGRNKHLITLLTGGKIQAEPLGAKRRWEKAKRKEQERLRQGLETKPRKRFLQKDILYLMVVNLPDEAALNKARAELEKSSWRKAVPAAGGPEQADA